MYLWCFLYLASLYILQMVTVGPFFWEWLPFSFWLVGTATLISLLVGGVGICLAMAGMLRSRQDGGVTRRLRRVALLLKLLTIPFYLIHLATWALVSTALLIIPGLQVLLLANFLGIAFAYGVLLTGSVYSLLAIWVARREGKLGNKGMVLWGISQFIFVVDVPACLLMLLQTAKRRAPEKEVR